MVSINLSVLIQIVNFLFLIWILNSILYKPIRGILIQRNKKIEGLTSEIDTCKGHVRDKAVTLADKRNEAKATGLMERESVQQEALVEERRILDEINKKAQAELTEMRARIAKDVDAARSALNQQIDTYAKAISQKILGREV